MCIQIPSLTQENRVDVNYGNHIKYLVSGCRKPQHSFLAIMINPKCLDGIVVRK